MAKEQEKLRFQLFDSQESSVMFLLAGLILGFLSNIIVAVAGIKEGDYFWGYFALVGIVILIAFFIFILKKSRQESELALKNLQTFSKEEMDQLNTELNLMSLKDV
ncbi:TPA: hypothetical protein HA244_05685 [Candidatus Micrarchaeota archaeon]|nr:hypothetical protein [Candidatus Micrarchaeota archaeon]